jgi:predicted transposase YdaD
MLQEIRRGGGERKGRGRGRREGEERKGRGHSHANVVSHKLLIHWAITKLNLPLMEACIDQLLA